MNNLIWGPYDNNKVNDSTTPDQYDDSSNIMSIREKLSGASRLEALDKLIITDHLLDDEREKLLDICFKYSEVFFLEGDILQATDVITHRIPTPNLTKPINELLQLSDIRVYYANDNIVYLINLPLVYQTQLTLFAVLAKPVKLDNNFSYVYVKPNFKYLAISKTNEHYTSYSDLDLLNCEVSKTFLLCPEIQTLHPTNMKPTCEVQLFQNTRIFPSNCNIQYLNISYSIFHKLKYKNQWIFTTPFDTLFLTCDNIKESISFSIEGVGILSLNESCKAYGKNDILIPSPISKDNIFTDVIPNTNISSLINSTLYKFPITHVTEYVNIHNLNDMANLKTELLLPNHEQSYGLFLSVLTILLIINILIFIVFIIIKVVSTRETLRSVEGHTGRNFNINNETVNVNNENINVLNESISVNNISNEPPCVHTEHSFVNNEPQNVRNEHLNSNVAIPYHNSNTPRATFHIPNRFYSVYPRL
ncbi:uncharacterized protein LOC126840102 [Adelges cooleyi]|uniref:uncharacterized protein LOC126840102 n=1 Tax=Adelges cooleyi TaxID=133065 RepID=UPI00217FD91E|nr:uncharacterized protein LOC126840102 [Adelges cooleyi]